MQPPTMLNSRVVVVNPKEQYGSTLQKQVGTLFKPQGGCPGCRQTGETVVMTNCFGIED